MVLQALCLYTQGEKVKSLQLLGDTLVLAEPDGFIRLFVDEGVQMTHLLLEISALGIMPDYVDKLLAAFKAEQQMNEFESYQHFTPSTQPLIEPLSQRELQVLQLVAQGLSNSEISRRLHLALSTVKGHNRNIYGKLQVERRTEAVARARMLGVL
jgi:LuxR family maltose regulon positive regulatory protein